MSKSKRKYQTIPNRPPDIQVAVEVWLLEGGQDAQAAVFGSGPGGNDLELDDAITWLHLAADGLDYQRPQKRALLGVIPGGKAQENELGVPGAQNSGEDDRIDPGA